MEAKVLQRCLAPFLCQGVLDHKSGWWFQILSIFQFDEHIFQVGWNHQPEIQFMHFLQGWLVSRIFGSTGLRDQILLGLRLRFVWGWKSCTWSMANVCKDKRPRGFPITINWMIKLFNWEILGSFWIWKSDTNIARRNRCFPASAL